MKAAGSLAALIALAATVAATPYPAQAEIAVSYLYKLCNFQGVVRIGSPKLSLDPFRRELYVITAEGVSVYNSSGMEIYQTDFDPERGLLYDLAVDEKGHIFTLSTLNSKMQINECNYRLEPRRRI